MSHSLAHVVSERVRRSLSAGSSSSLFSDKTGQTGIIQDEPVLHTGINDDHSCCSPTGSDVDLFEDIMFDNPKKKTQEEDELINTNIKNETLSSPSSSVCHDDIISRNLQMEGMDFVSTQQGIIPNLVNQSNRLDRSITPEIDDMMIQSSQPVPAQIISKRLSFKQKQELIRLYSDMEEKGHEDEEEKEEEEEDEEEESIMMSQAVWDDIDMSTDKRFSTLLYTCTMYIHQKYMQYLCTYCKLICMFMYMYMYIHTPCIIYLQVL